jgi:hypothetical protein
VLTQTTLISQNIAIEAKASVWSKRVNSFGFAPAYPRHAQAQKSALCPETLDTTGARS